MWGLGVRDSHCGRGLSLPSVGALCTAECVPVGVYKLCSAFKGLLDRRKEKLPGGRDWDQEDFSGFCPRPGPLWAAFSVWAGMVQPQQSEVLRKWVCEFQYSQEAALLWH